MKNILLLISGFLLFFFINDAGSFAEEKTKSIYDTKDKSKTKTDSEQDEIIDEADELAAAMEHPTVKLCLSYHEAKLPYSLGAEKYQKTVNDPDELMHFEYMTSETCMCASEEIINDKDFSTTKLQQFYNKFVLPVYKKYLDQFKNSPAKEDGKEIINKVNKSIEKSFSSSQGKKIKKYHNKLLDSYNKCHEKLN